MATNRLPAFSRALAAIAVLGLMGAAACSGASAPSSSTPPSSSPRATASPTPTPSPDPAAALEKLFDDPDLTARIELYGEVVSADQSGNVDRRTLGTLEIAGSDEREHYEYRDQGEPQPTRDFISIGSEEWKSTDGGPWTASDATDDEPFLSKLDRIEGFQDLGIEAKGGRDLHHLRLAPGLTLDLDDWGPSDERYSNFELELDFWVEADGTPVIMERNSTFTYTEAGTSIELKSLSEATFEAVGDPLEFAPPDDVWRTFKSTAGRYSIGYPDDVEVASKEGVDTFTVDDSLFMNISSQAAPAGLGLDAWREDLVADLAADGAEFVDTKPARVGGSDAQLLTFKTKMADGGEGLVLDMIVIGNGRAIEIATVSALDAADETRTGLAHVLTTFEFAE